MERTDIECNLRQPVLSTFTYLDNHPVRHKNDQPEFGETGNLGLDSMPIVKSRLPRLIPL